MKREHFAPAPYQSRIARAIAETPRCAVWLKMGLRKTATTLMAIQELLWLGEVKRVLVVAPLRVAANVWPAELAKWDLFQGITCTRLQGAPAWREMARKQVTDIHTINFEKLPWLCERWGRDWPYDMIIIDESSKFKAPSGMRLRALRNQLRVLEKRGKHPRIVELTGTQSPNSLVDLWPQIHLLDGGERLGRTLTVFRDRWFSKSGYGGYEYKPVERAAEEIADALTDIVFALNDDESLQLPDLIINPIRVPLPENKRAEYRELERRMLVEFKALSDQVAAGEKSHTVAAVNAAALTGKCLQFASGAMFLQDELGQPTREWAVVHDEKLDALEDVIEEANGAPVLVAYWFQHDLARLRKRFPTARTLRKGEDFDDWNAGKIPIGLIHPASAGHGLNLQDGGSILVWFSMQWSLELYMQTNARLHRSGQRDPVTVHLLLAEDTIDELVPERLAGKASVQELLTQRLRMQEGDDVRFLQRAAISDALALLG